MIISHYLHYIPLGGMSGACMDSPAKIVQLDIEGMTCASCVAHVEKAIKKHAGIDMAAVNLATEKATVSYDPAEVDLNTIIQSVSDAGYSAAEYSGEESDEAAAGKKREARLLGMETLASLILSAPLVLAMAAGMLRIEPLMFLHNPLLQLLLATPVQFWIGRRFYIPAFRSLKSLNPGMDVLVVMGTSAAYLFSIFNGFFAASLGIESGGLYFEASSVIITLVLLGRFLEQRAKGKTSEALKKLMGLQPKTARVERDGEVITVPAADVEAGDILHIKPGERFPVDGSVTEGLTTADESMISGESLPVDKTIGDKVLSGTINGYGSIRYRAEQVGSESVLSRIIAVVEEAQGSKAPIQKLADKIAAVFVPVVLGIALLTFLVWWLWAGTFQDGLIAAVAVLVIACPCALGLATPTAIMVGTGVGAGRGILIRNGEVLQQAGRIDTVVLDKTGTITMGKPRLQHVYAGEGAETGGLLSVAASLEAHSEHPLALAIVDAAEKQGLNPSFTAEYFTAVPGKGIRGSVKGVEYVIGTELFMADKGIDCEALKDKKKEFEALGHTVIILADTSKALALFSISDSIRDKSVAGIAALKDMGISVHMITGDNRRTAEAIAAEAGIDNILAEVLPEQKAEEVKKLQAEGRVVAMAGDGINDAPALAVADVGIAMAEGTDIAMESADITLMRSDLSEIAVTILLSRKTMSKIRQNLFWAFFYNSVGIPFAALGMLNPVIAGAAMAFSSVSVVSNSLSLKQFKLRNNSSRASKGRNSHKESNMTEIITVDGMSCNHCKMSVEKAALSVEGVSAAEVNLEKKELAVSFSDGAENMQAVRTAVEEAGYSPL